MYLLQYRMQDRELTEGMYDGPVDIMVSEIVDVSF